MLKASALYIVIIIALVIGILCSAVIVAAYFYRNEYQKKFRYDRLENNVSSGINILLAGADTSNSAGSVFSLFNNDADSVSLKRLSWGLYDVGIVKAFDQKDTLYKTLMIGHTVDSSKWAALYMADREYPLSLSGKTIIKGNAWLPKSGITEAYIDNKAYEGDKGLVIGHKYTSDKNLPPLDSNRLTQMALLFSGKRPGDSSINKDSICNSFLSDTRVFNMGKKIDTLKSVTLAGNVIIRSDTTILIDSSATLDNVMVFAKSIFVKPGFHGKCQLYATDSIGISQKCQFTYPSCIGIVSYKPSPGLSPQIKIDSNTTFTGIIFTYKKYKGTNSTIIEIGKNVTISGQIYAQESLKFTDSSVISGSVFAGDLLYKKDFKFFRGYLIDAHFNVNLLSPYYLTSGLIPVAAKKKKVLQWLESN